MKSLSKGIHSKALGLKKDLPRLWLNKDGEARLKTGVLLSPHVHAIEKAKRVERRTKNSSTKIKKTQAALDMFRGTNIIRLSNRKIIIIFILPLVVVVVNLAMLEVGKLRVGCAMQ